MIKILCIEDEMLIRHQIVEELQDEGYEVVEASDGQHGLEMILEHKPDIVISDISMPRLNGYDLLLKVRSEFPHLAEMPFVFLTAYSDRADMLRGFDIGVDDYLTKPIDFDILLSKINALISQVNRMKNKNRQQLEHITDRMNQAQQEATDVSKELEKQTELWRFQAQLLEVVTRNPNTKVAADKLCRIMESSVSAGTCMVMKRLGETLQPLAAPNADETWAKLLDGLPAKDLHGSCGTAASCGVPQFVADTQRDPRWTIYADAALQHNIHACWSHPTLGPSGEVHGTVSMSFSEVRKPSMFERDLIRIAAYFLGSLMERDEHLETNVAMQAELRVAEAASEQTKSFLTTMSHEIRTPMNGVLGALDLIQTAQTPEERQALLDIAMESSESLLRLINDILDISRMDVEGVTLKNESGSLADVIGSVVRSLTAIARKKEIDLRTKVHELTNVRHIFDDLRLRQVLNNIIGNAIKFTTSGEVCIGAKVLDETAKTSTVQFVIRDTGGGIPEHQLGSIFERFKMVDGSYSRSAPGTGLGLAISQQIIDAMGGKIEVESQLGEGTIFTIIIELCKSDGAVAASKASDNHLNNGPSLKILIAEDNEVNAMIAMSMLKKSGHEVIRASNGKEAVVLASDNAFDIILMDVSMPVMDGVAATREIRSGYDKNCDTPIIALTAHVVDSEDNEFISAGMTSYLSKPIRRDALMMAIDASAQAHGNCVADLRHAVE